jgi:hypothetical protein
MKKVFIISTLLIAGFATTYAQSGEKNVNSTKPLRVDKNVKQLKTNSSKAEQVGGYEEEEHPVEEQARPNEITNEEKKKSIQKLKSIKNNAGSTKALNPQPFPPVDAKAKNIKTQ